MTKDKIVKLTETDLKVLDRALTRMDIQFGKDIKDLTAAGEWGAVQAARGQRSVLRRVAKKVLA